jgi:cell division protein ZapA (FtsZ GTPase activity inhibitor)
MEPTPDREESMLAEAMEEVEARAAYRIENTDDEIVVRIRRGMLSEERLRRLLALMVLDEVRQKSQLTEEGASELADMIDRAVWEKLRDRAGSGT